MKTIKNLFGLLLCIFLASVATRADCDQTRSSDLANQLSHWLRGGDLFDSVQLRIEVESVGRDQVKLLSIAYNQALVEGVTSQRRVQLVQFASVLLSPIEFSNYLKVHCNFFGARELSVAMGWITRNHERIRDEDLQKLLTVILDQVEAQVFTNLGEPGGAWISVHLNQAPWNDQGLDNTIIRLLAKRIASPLSATGFGLYRAHGHRIHRHEKEFIRQVQNRMGPLTEPECTILLAEAILSSIFSDESIDQLMSICKKSHPLFPERFQEHFDHTEGKVKHPINSQDLGSLIRKAREELSTMRLPASIFRFEGN